MTATSSIRAVVIVVPVHDEEALLDRRLVALGAAVDAARERGIRCIVRVVLDACTDSSPDIALRHPFESLVIDAATVGIARAAGIAAGLADIRWIPPQRVWIANTDADSAVPVNWITAQVDAAAAGADVFVGTVRPDFADLTPAHRRLWRDTHTPGRPNGHVHGTSLGLRASAYAMAGGFAPAVEHEDVELVDACRRGGAVIVATDSAEVLTSGRLIGRTPGGYAGHLREQRRLLGSGDRAPVTDPAGER